MVRSGSPTEEGPHVEPRLAVHIDQHAQLMDPAQGRQLVARVVQTLPVAPVLSDGPVGALRDLRRPVPLEEGRRFSDVFRDGFLGEDVFAGVEGDAREFAGENNGDSGMICKYAVWNGDGTPYATMTAVISDRPSIAARSCSPSSAYRARSRSGATLLADFRDRE